MEKIVYWDREARKEAVEQVYGERLVRLLYGTKPGRLLSDGVLSREWLSRAVGAYHSSRLSRRKIDRFVREFGIPMEEYEDGGFSTFNEFFIRRFRPGARTFDADSRRMPAFAEARYLAYERINPDAKYVVKGEYLAPEAILGSGPKARFFTGGPMLIARLCPVDYHRFHYPDSGKTLDHYAVSGALHSVNPLALRFRGDILSTNERKVTVLECANLGKIAYVEVGAMCVGKIVQTHSPDLPFERGEEKGYFLFGASTVIVIGERGRWRPDADLLEQTRNGRETFVKLGAAIGSRS